MTACVNNQNEVKGGVSHKVLRSVVAGVLAVSMVPTTALASEGEGAQLFAAGSTDSANSWSGVEFTWNVTADKWGNYSVQAGDQFYVTSAKDVFGDPVSASDYKVIYVDSTNAYEETPSTPGDYTAYLVEGGLPEGFVFTNGKIVLSTKVDHDLDGGTTATMSLTEWLTANESKTQTQDFKVTPLSLEGAFAYDSTADGVSDKSFKFGTNFTIAFADADGNELIADDSSSSTTNDSYKVNWVKPDGTTQSTAPTAAGTYTAVLTGINSYAGSVEEVTVKIDAIDLAKDVFTVKPIVKPSTGNLKNAFGSDGVLDETTYPVYINGEALTSTGTIKATALSMVAADGTVKNSGFNEIGYLGKISLVIEDEDTTSSNFVDAGAKGTASVLVVEKDVTFKYGKEALSDGSKIATFNASKGEGFDASKITAEALKDVDVPGVYKNVPCDVTVTKDGEAVDSYDEPGVYDVVVTAEAPAGSYEYAGEGRYTFEVVSAHYENEPAVYAVIDGVDADGQQVEYDGEAVEPRIVAKDGKTVLTEGEDYTVTVEDAKGDAVESAVEPGVYTWTVDFADAVYGDNDTPVKPVTFDVEITKAVVESAKAGKSVYAYTGEPVAPTFTAYTDKNCKGLSVEVDPSKTAVTYYKAVVDPNTGEPETAEYNAAGEVAASATDKTVAFVGWKYDAANKLTASDVVEPGYYVAFVSAPAGDAHFQGTAVQAAQFEVSETVEYADVDANEWYAQSVYDARDLGYMTGVGGTKLFMPEAGIDREQVACVLFNMAGVDSAATNGNALGYFPTAFSDVDGWAWYAEAVSWASQAGVMNGYAGTDRFGVSEKTTREQVAAIFYNYAKSQGKDVSVKDVDGTLAKYADGSQVSPWMREAVAWAVENGVMGNGELLSPLEDVTRAQMAAMAVNFQPEKLK